MHATLFTPVDIRVHSQRENDQKLKTNLVFLMNREKRMQKTKFQRMFEF